jgi:hypothetical protein
VGVAGDALERLGPVGHLALVQRQAIEIAVKVAGEFEFSAKEFEDDATVCVLALGVALAHQEELMLQAALREELVDRALTMGSTAGRALVDAVKHGYQDKTHKHIERLHERANAYRKELRALAVSRGKSIRRKTPVLGFPVQAQEE